MAMATPTVETGPAELVMAAMVATPTRGVNEMLSSLGLPGVSACDAMHQP